MGNRVVSVVVPTYNRAQMVRDALLSLASQDLGNEYSLEIIVVDNASTDCTKDVVDEVARNSPVAIRYVFEDNKGYPMALNRGAREGLGEWIAFFDDDQLAESNWLKELLKVCLEKNADCVGGTIRVRLPEDDKFFLLGSTSRGMIGEKIFCGEAQECVGKTIPSGGNMLISRRVFESIGYFDTSFSSGCDSDLLRRALREGFTVWTAPKAVIHHMMCACRLEPSYFKWVSLRWGVNFAKMDRKNKGKNRMFLMGIARVGQAMLINIPILLLEWVKRNKKGMIDRKCLIWRAIGYSRQCVCFASPKLFSQRRFFETLHCLIRKHGGLR